MGVNLGLQGIENVLLVTASRPDLGPTQPPIQWVAGVASSGLRWPGREADLSPRSSADVNNA